MSYYNVQDRIYNELAFEMGYFILFDLQLAFLQFLLSFQKSSQYQFSSLIFTMFFHAVFWMSKLPFVLQMFFFV